MTRSGKLSIKPAGEFLFAVEAALHFPLLGNVHKGSLVTHKFSGGVAYRRRRVHRNHVAPILAVPQRDFMRAQESEIAQLALFLRAVFGLAVQGGDFAVNKSSLLSNPSICASAGLTSVIRSSAEAR